MVAKTPRELKGDMKEDKKIKFRRYENFDTAKDVVIKPYEAGKLFCLMRKDTDEIDDDALTAASELLARNIEKTLLEISPQVENGVLIKGFRLRECLTQKQLAEKLGLSHTYISKLELGHRPLTKDLREKISKALNFNENLFE